MDFRFHIFCVVYTTCYLEGGRRPNVSIRNLAKIAFLSTDGGNFSFRQIPAASANFRGLRFPHVLCNLDNELFGSGSAAKVLDP